MNGRMSEGVENLRNFSMSFFSIQNFLSQNRDGNVAGENPKIFRILGGKVFMAWCRMSHTYLNKFTDDCPTGCKEIQLTKNDPNECSVKCISPPCPFAPPYATSINLTTLICKCCSLSSGGR